MTCRRCNEVAGPSGYCRGCMLIPSVARAIREMQRAVAAEARRMVKAAASRADDYHGARCACGDAKHWNAKYCDPCRYRRAGRVA